MNDFSWRTRSAAHQRIAQEELDILIIGGGITGAGIMLDAATRGLRVALIEKRDFASGTSSRSTKLIHGGLRYLEHFDFALVREGLRERAILSRIAPNLVEPFLFLIPIYDEKCRNYDHPFKMRLGLWLYDLLSTGAGFNRHHRMTREQVLEIAPQLDPQGLRGAFAYYDAQTDDARLVIAVLKSASAQGALATNYTCAVGFIHNAEGQIIGAHLRDELTGAEFESRAHLIINATGIWTDEVRTLSHPTTSIVDRVRPSKGIHLIIAAERLQVKTAWLIPSLIAHRFYFVLPWKGRVLIGTTDTDYMGDKNAPHAEADEVREILHAINSYFPTAQLEPVDVIATFAGLRPLVSDDQSATTHISRKDEIIDDGDGLISITGGKLTTYRHMAERAVDFAVRQLTKRFSHSNIGPSRTRMTALSGNALNREALELVTTSIAHAEGLQLDTARHLIRAYGSDYEEIIKIACEGESLRGRLIPDLPYIAAEVSYAVRHEMALTLADMLVRRMRLVLLAGQLALDCAPRVAQLMAVDLGWNEAEIGRQIEQFKTEYECEYALPKG